MFFGRKEIRNFLSLAQVAWQLTSNDRNPGSVFKRGILAYKPLSPHSWFLIPVLI